MLASKSSAKPQAASQEEMSISMLGIAQICSWGTLYYSFPQLAEAMMSEFFWNKSETYAALTLSFLFSALAAIPVGKAIDKGQGRKVMTAASLLAGLLFMSGSQLSTLWGVYIVFAGIGALQAATLYDAAFSVIANHFDAGNSRRHITTLTLWGGFAATLFIPLIELLLQYGGWRNTMIVLGLINIAVGLLIYRRLPTSTQRSAKKDHQERSSRVKSEEAGNKTVRWALGQPMFWSLLFCFSFFAAAGTTFKFHLYPMLLEKGLSVSEVVAIVVVLGPAQVAGRFLLSLLSKELSIVNLGIFTASVLPVVFLAFAYLSVSIWLLIPFALAFGAASGIMTIVKGVAVPELLTREAYGAINGAMNIPVKLIKAFSPWIAAVIWHVGGGYHTVLVFLAFLGLISAISFILATKVKRYQNCKKQGTI
ncbi:MFS transporter [Pseudoteredinibacter isoporae]|uniref:Putative MFS family arabinose efflux permease n=1 Tax=Pseudoteredinibacter isoporae TaxID=570281 RepID=A0A7X0JQU3_9GAMM|nr:MFS transporter [Pseudoteredinibacter isoporae]MBB6520618.1 putative MFS family arabinose efflux permease [Pseudoteredinibacter isoporae]NHO86185.1 MFS transporter [Pseudoteredinibacter isoporae]NIB25364.1 MFS transporter [Pseudoteredinibacter isoporae]